jgi:hypothetical protein
MGFFALGASVVWLARLVLKSNQTARGQGPVFLALLPLYGAGAAVLLKPNILASQSSNYFPIGMLLAFCWLGMDTILPGLDSSNRREKFSSIVKLLLAVVLSGILLIPAFQF